ncbi:MAG: M3 family oligoendopeptidase [Corallococcus sp.]|nr:M3 family oligoendopeptidase [Corallococcus sp.]
MVKVSQIEYKRIAKEEILAKLDEFGKRFDSAKSCDEFLKVHADYKEYSEHISTVMQVAFIRFTLDTRDEFYANEQDYLDEITPEIGVKSAEINKRYLTTPFRKQLEKVFPSVMFTNLQMQIDANSPLIVEEKVEQNKLVTAYTKLMSGLTVNFNGETLTPAALRKYFTDADRSLRRGAYMALGQCLEDNKQQLDELYDKLVKVRTVMGRKLGYDNFSPLGYLSMQRNCYGKEDIAKFRANVKKYFVPLAVKIREKVGKDLNLGQQYIYDDAVFTKDSPKPIGTVDEIFANGSKMYHEMSEETGRLFDLMVESQAFDVMSREGKWGGGYCTGLPEYKLPFILSNFNGSAGDIEVLTHEFGHAYEYYKSFDIDTEFLSSISMETAEVHSMSMEFLAYPWMELFFGDKTSQYKFYHIGSAVTFIPYGTIVDYFQQTCYDNPDMTPAQRNEFYNKIEKEFMPYMTTEGIPAIQDGRRWQRQAHIYESPFYYIDYCLAQFTALQFLALSQKDYDAALKNYVKFLSFGGTKTFTQLIEECGLSSPFEEKSFAEVVNTVEKILEL